MPNKRTFQIKPIKRLIEREKCNGVWIDLFPYPFKRDALEHLLELDDSSIDGVLFDPPFSFHQANISYDAEGRKVTNTYRRDIKDEIRRVIKAGGKCVSFGWNSNGIGQTRGFEITRILLVAHGGGHNDTIVTVERKVQESLV